MCFEVLGKKIKYFFYNLNIVVSISFVNHPELVFFLLFNDSQLDIFDATFNYIILFSCYCQDTNATCSQQTIYSMHCKVNNKQSDTITFSFMK